MAVPDERNDGAQTAPQGDAEPVSGADERRRRADQYFDRDLRGQRSWYSARAARQKTAHAWLSIVILAAGAATSFVQLFAPTPSNHAPNVVAVVTALLGVVVVVAKGVERIWRFEDTWSDYRKASEAMKHEYRVYVNAAGSYRTLEGEDARYALFVDRVEQIIASEQRAFWGRRAEEQPAESVVSAS